MIDITLLGPVVVTVGGTRLTAADLGGSKPRQVLEMLALALGHAMSKDTIAERLWEDGPPATCIATLESYVCGLRRRLGRVEGVRGPLLTTSGGYFLDPSQVRVDVVDLRNLAPRDVLGIRSSTLPTSESLLTGDPYASWANREREVLAEQLSEMYLRAAHQANLTGQNGPAARFARAAAHERPWSEPALQELLRALSQAGNRAEALMEFQSFRSSMLDELGVEPSQATRSIYLSILRDESRPEPDVDDVSLLVSLLKAALEASGTARAGGALMGEVASMLLARA